MRTHDDDSAADYGDQELEESLPLDLQFEPAEEIVFEPAPMLMGIEDAEDIAEFREDPITEAVRDILRSHCAPYSDTTKLKDMGGANVGVRTLIAHDIDREFPDLNPRFRPNDVKAEDTLTTLAERVAGRFV